jgi:pyruvate dehydrogenase E2 component (dihydrolipoamide acetyltransferase)
MAIELKMPALSPTMEEGTLARWLVKEGDSVSSGDILAEIETDKATMEVEAVDEGIIGKILVQGGTANVLVGAAIALILEEDSDKAGLDSYQIKGLKSAAPASSASAPKEEKVQEIQVAAANTSNNTSRIFASPLAKRIAADKSINLANIEGSGPHGRIIKADVTNVTTSSAIPSAAPAVRTIAPAGGYTLEPHSNMRKVIAKRLVESKQTVPHFYLNIDCNLDKLLLIRSEVNSTDGKGHKFSVNDFVIKACAMALAKVPAANSSWSEEGVIHYNDVDIAVAVAIEGGLITPLIRQANFKSLTEISNEMKGLAARAREGKLKPEEYQGGGFSISNLGMFGIKQFSAIINPPQSCILAVGAGIKTPVVCGNEIKISTLAHMTLSCDHRVVDGAVGAQFLAAFKEYMENPVKMLV